MIFASTPPIASSTVFLKGVAIPLISISIPPETMNNAVNRDMNITYSSNECIRSQPFVIMI